MSTVASRDLRNHTASVLRQVAAGATVTITVNGAPVADVVPHRSDRRPFFTRGELATLLPRQADPELRTTLRRLAGESTADLGPLP